MSMNKTQISRWTMQYSKQTPNFDHGASASQDDKDSDHKSNSLIGHDVS